MSFKDANFARLRAGTILTGSLYLSGAPGEISSGPAGSFSRISIVAGSPDLLSFIGPAGQVISIQSGANALQLVGGDFRFGSTGTANSRLNNNGTLQLDFLGTLATTSSLPSNALVGTGGSVRLFAYKTTVAAGNRGRLYIRWGITGKYTLVASEPA